MVVAALDACLRAFADNPSLSGTIGLLEEDLVAAQGILTGLGAADAMSK